MIEKNYEHEQEKDDVVFEEESTESSIEDAKKALHKLRIRLKQAEADKQEYLHGWQRSQAEFINARKRDEESHKELVKFAESGLILDILPVLDSFDSAFAHEKDMGELPEQWRTGMKNIYNQLTSILLARGLKPLEPLGKPFNPLEHEAIGVIPTDDPANDHTILEVVQKGYTLHDKLVRTARVRVGQYEQRN